MKTRNTVSLAMSEELQAQLDEAAAAEGRSRSSMASLIIRRYLLEWRRQQCQEEENEHQY